MSKMQDETGEDVHQRQRAFQTQQLALPLQFDVFQFCCVSDVGRVACTNTEWSEAARNPHVWGILVHRDYESGGQKGSNMYRWYVACQLMKTLLQKVIVIQENVVNHAEYDFDEDVLHDLETAVRDAEVQGAPWTPLFYRFCGGSGIAGGGPRAERMVRRTLQELTLQREEKEYACAQVQSALAYAEIVRQKIWRVLCGGLPSHEREMTASWAESATKWAPYPLSSLPVFSVADKAEESDNHFPLTSYVAISSASDLPPRELALCVEIVRYRPSHTRSRVVGRYEV